MNLVIKSLIFYRSNNKISCIINFISKYSYRMCLKYFRSLTTRFSRGLNNQVRASRVSNFKMTHSASDVYKEYTPIAFTSIADAVGFTAADSVP